MFKPLLFIMIAWASKPLETVMVPFPVQFEDKATCMAWLTAHANKKLPGVRRVVRDRGGEVVAEHIDCVESREERSA